MDGTRGALAATTGGDVAVAVAALLIAVLVPDPDRAAGAAFAPLPAPVVLLAVASCAVLLLRRRRPVAVLVVTLAAAVAAQLLVGERTLLTIAPMVALFEVAVHGRRSTTALAATVTTVALLATGWATTGLDPDLLTYLAWSAAVVAAGDGLASRRAYVTSVRERAERLEQDRESDAQRRVIEERLRIARELHDVVAHSIAVISVQAGVASHLLPDRPDAAQQALGHVRHAAGTVLAELGGLLDVLRSPGELTGPTTPAPGLDRLQDLVASFAPSGLRVRWSVSGRPRPATGGVDLVAYRVVQEALTNAAKHGAGTASLTVSYTEQGLELEVDNPLGGGPAGRPGHGLAGMHERAHAVGGRLEVTPARNGRFRVTAVLPLPPAIAVAEPVPAR